MRVLQAVKTASGATWALRQMRELVRLGVDVHVLMPEGALTPGYRDAGVHVHRLRDERRAFAEQLPSIVEEVDPDLLHTHFVGQTLAARWALRDHSVPRVFQVPGPLHLEHAPTRNLDLLSATDRDYWIAACTWSRDTFTARARRPENVGLSYYGADVDDFTSKAIARDPLTVRKPTIIGMVSYIYKPKRYLGQRVGLKGHEDFIDAVRLLLDDGLDVQARVAGDAWGSSHEYAAKAKAYAKRRCGDRMQFLGHVTDIPALYNSIDVAVHPSHSENHGGAVESLLMGVPTVATAVGGFPDIVREGETGYLAPARSPEKLALAIREAVLDPQASIEMASRGQALVEREFDVRRTARQVRDIYERILEGSPLQ